MNWVKFLVSVIVVYVLGTWVFNLNPIFAEDLVIASLSKLPRDRQDALLERWNNAFERRSGSHSRVRFAVACLIDSIWARILYTVRVQCDNWSDWNHRWARIPGSMLYRWPLDVAAFRLPRFPPSFGLRGLGWYLVCFIMVPACYTVTAQAAAEHKKLEMLERKIARTKKQIRNLNTEFAVRSNFLQLQKWSEELGLMPIVRDRVCTDSQCVLAVIDRDLKTKLELTRGKGKRRHIAKTPKGS